MNKSIAIALLGLLGASAFAAGPTSTLYAMNYGEFSGGAVVGLDLIQGLAESSFATGNNIDICIAVSGDVRTMGYGATTSGSRFNLAGGPLSGGPYTNNIVNSQLHDGTTDGKFNYSVNFTTGDVLEFDRNWATPVVLFNVSGSLPGAGWITMNPTDGSFWLSQWGGPDVVHHVSHTGTLLGSFNSGVSNCAGLALDPADGTLWMGDWANPFTLHQFSQAGALLQSSSYTLSGAWYGMEFELAPAPEPASVMLIGIGAVALMRRRRRISTP